MWITDVSAWQICGPQGGVKCSLSTAARRRRGNSLSPDPAALRIAASRPPGTLPVPWRCLLATPQRPREAVSLVYCYTAAPRGAAPVGSTVYRAKAQCHVVVAPTLYAHAAAAKLHKKPPGKRQYRQCYTLYAHAAAAKLHKKSLGKQDASVDIVLHIEHCLMAASPRSVSVTAATQSCIIAESPPRRSPA